MKPTPAGQICFIEISGAKEDTVTLLRLTKSLPAHVQAAIARKKISKHRLRKAAGWLALKYQLIQNGCDTKLMDGIQTTNYGKPFIPGIFNFNISYSGNFAICAVSNVNQLGVDIELVKEINFSELRGYFNNAEWNKIAYSENPQNSFFQYWTKKESVLKADGRGFYVDPRDVTVGETTGRISNSSVQYHLFSLPDIDDKLAGTLCTDQPNICLTVERIDIACLQS